MSRGLIDPENTVWRKAIGCLVAVFIVPIGVLAALLATPFARPIKRTPEEVVSCLRDFIEGTGGPWDWDDFVSIPIADPRLEAIRKRASKFPDVGPGELEALLSEAEVLGLSRLMPNG